MDVANYVSELLMQNGRVNVPGLGYFTLLKVDGYYNNAEGKFHPPTIKIQFDEQHHDDDEVLLQYIAIKKKISLASSKYFTAKYIENLRQEAMVKQVPLADLGTLYFEDNKLRFNPASVLPADPAYYGYPPVSITKLQSTSVYEQIDQVEKEMSSPAVSISSPPKPETDVQADASTVADQVPPAYVSVPPLPQPEPDVPIGAPPVTEQTTPEAEIFTPQPGYNSSSAADHEEEFIFAGRSYSGEEYEGRNNNWIWITITVVAVLGIIGIFALYKFKPDTFNRMRGVQPAPVVLKTTKKHDTIKTVTPAVKVDTATVTPKNTPVDTTTKAASVNAPAAIDTFARVRYEILGGAFRTKEDADKTIASYKRMGFEAGLVKNVPGRLFKVTLGTYFTEDEAVNRMHAIVKTGQIGANRMSIQPYNPKK